MEVLCMASTVVTTPEVAEVPTEPIWRLSVDQYHEMIEAGILTDLDRVELLEGLLVLKMTKQPPHTVAIDLTRLALQDVIPENFCIRSQDPVTCEGSEPEPDIAVVRGKLRDFAKRHPATREVPLLIEASDTTLRRDRGLKKRIYAGEKIPVYWIINLIDGQVEVYTDPTGPGDQPDYRQRQDYHPGDEIPVVIDGKEVGRISVSELLP